MLRGTKNGLLLGEVVVVLNPEAAPGLERARKTSMQLASKMRFISAQFDALLGTDLWLRNARHANAMAQRLATAVAELPGVTVQHEVDANAVFAVLPADAEAALRTRVSFSDWNTAGAAVRWMTSFDTTEDDVDHFVATLGEVLAGASGRVVVAADAPVRPRRRRVTKPGVAQAFPRIRP